MPDLAHLALQWPLALVLLVIPAALLVRSALRWPRVSTAPGSDARARALRPPDGWPDRVALLLMVAGLAVLILALARPRAPIWMPAAIDRVIIAIDASGSMRADDVSPSRIEVARQTTRRLIDAMPASAQIGLVSLAANAAVVQASTRDREALRSALDRLSLQPGSALGSGVAVGLAELLPEARIDVEALVGGVSRRSGSAAQAGASGSPPGASAGAARDGARKEPFERPDPPIDPASRKDAILVVLADGDSNFGPDPRKIAEIAQLWGVRIYTVGIGTAQGVVLRSEGVSARVRLEEKTLRDIAQISGGEYFSISDAENLSTVYASLSGRIGLRKRQEAEITAWVAVLGMVLVVVAALMSTATTGRVFGPPLQRRA